MKDTHEIPEGTEQVKATQARTRQPARARSESAPAASSEHDTRSAAPRRRPASSPTTTHANGNGGAATNAPRNEAGAPVHPAREEHTAAPQQRGAERDQRDHGAHSAATHAPSHSGQGQRSGNSGSHPSGQRGGSGGSQGYGQRNSYPNSSRPANTPNHQRSGNAGGTPGQGGSFQRDSQRNAPRSGGSAPTAYRPAQPAHSGPPSGQNRPGTSRPTGNGGGRPGNGARPGGARPASSAQRTQERRAAAVKEKITGPVQIPPQIIVKDLAELLHATPNEVIRGLIKHGIFANINEVVEYEKAALVAQELGFEPSQSTVTSTATQKGERQLSANEAMMASRNDDGTVVIPPVVTIMGHVDHGKTSLLDTIRKTKVAAGEAGGITQHIGAYQVEVNGKKITFLDTPGHEAFTAMRARGAQVTHIAIIVVAADDGVMPQTREAIDHARAAKVPIIIALNKIDKANANPDRVKQQLAEIGLVIEEYGGDTVCVPVSARRGTGIDELLEYILLVAEVQDIRANPNRLATGVIIEAKLEKNTGPMATVLVQQGTLKMGDNIIVGSISGKVRAMFNDRGKRIQKAPPSTPVSMIGLPEVPQAGDHLEVVADERTAKQRAQQEADKRRDESMPLGQVSLDTLYMQMQEGKVKELNIVLKCDVQGTAEAIKNALTKVGEENLKVRLIHEGIGNISETDVHLAAASGAVIIAFNVKADGAAQRQAQKEGVDIRNYNVIYKLTDDIQAALVGMLEPTYREVVEGHGEVLQIFKAGKNVVIAGCRVTDGKITRNSQIRVMRKDEKVHEGKLASLRRGKDDVREVASGYECGIVLEDFSAFEIGDIIEAFTQERVKAGL